jgi:hypothetical protein
MDMNDKRIPAHPNGQHHHEMHHASIRFGPELWLEMLVAADAAGVSVSEYVREAVVARLATGAGIASRRLRHPDWQAALVRACTQELRAH